MKEKKTYIIYFLLAIFTIVNSILMLSGNIFLELGKAYKKNGEIEKSISSYKIASYFTPFYDRIYYEWGYILNRRGIKENNIQQLFESIALFETSLMNNPSLYRAELLLLETKEYLHILKKPLLEYLYEMNEVFPNNIVIKKILFNEKKISERRNHLLKFKLKWKQEFKNSMQRVDKKALKTFFDYNGLFIENGDMYFNTEILLLLKIESNSGYVKINAKSSPYDGIFAKMHIELNEKPLGTVFVNSKNDTSYIFNFNNQILGDGILSIQYTNDAYSEELKQDRNLYINFVEIFSNNDSNKS